LFKGKCEKFKVEILVDEHSFNFTGIKEVLKELPGLEGESIISGDKRFPLLSTSLINDEEFKLKLSDPVKTGERFLDKIGDGMVLATDDDTKGFNKFDDMASANKLTVEF
jgi:hypothetical protein